MASNAAAKKIFFVAAGGTAYLSAVCITYQYMTARNNAAAAAVTSLNNNNDRNATSKDKNTMQTSSTSNSAVFDYLARQDTFQRVAKKYDDELKSDEFVMGIYLLRRALIFFHARGTVLEVAAGTGRNLDYYSPKHVEKVFILDSSDQMLLEAKQKIQQKRQQQTLVFETRVGDASNLTSYYADNSFDTVVDTFGLCSFDDPVAVLKQIQRVCKPDGKILLLEHGRSNSYQGISNYLDKQADTHAKNWGCVWNRDIEQIIRDSGLHIEILHHFHFGTTYYMVCRTMPPQSKT